MIVTLRSGTFDLSLTRFELSLGLGRGGQLERMLTNCSGATAITMSGLKEQISGPKAEKFSKISKEVVGLSAHCLLQMKRRIMESADQARLCGNVKEAH